MHRRWYLVIAAAALPLASCGLVLDSGVSSTAPEEVIARREAERRRLQENGFYDPAPVAVLPPGFEAEEDTSSVTRPDQPLTIPGWCSDVRSIVDVGSVMLSATELEELRASVDLLFDTFQRLEASAPAELQPEVERFLVEAGAAQQRFEQIDEAVEGMEVVADVVASQGPRLDQIIGYANLNCVPGQSEQTKRSVAEGFSEVQSGAPAPAPPGTVPAG